ncbi:MAG: HNH endonuclease [Chloroflexi bacterium]|nr:HNH endonuclease [Chloroflexota bacterium]
MAKGGLWTYDELLLALNLYYKIPFGQFHQHNPKVIDLAKLINRTPSSVAMQLSNFASLDPYHQSRGISGLRPPGKLAQEIWIDMQNNWEDLIMKSEELLDLLAQPQDEPKTSYTLEEERNKAQYLQIQKEKHVPTEVERSVKVRLGQRFFRESIMANYRERCCVCGMPIPELLIASHIIPWKAREDLRLNPSNGLCLCVLHDKAFDRGLLSIDDDYKVMISSLIQEHSLQEAVKHGLTAYNEHFILLPDRFVPEKRFLQTHRNECFIW